MPTEPTLITPTEPIPTTPGSPMTYEQGERSIQLLTDSYNQGETSIQLLTDIKTVITEKFDSVIQLLTDIKTNTTPVVSPPPDPNAPPVGMTYEQAEQIISYMQSGLEIGGYVVAGVLLWFTLKQLYRLFGGVLFGGV